MNKLALILKHSTLPSSSWRFLLGITFLAAVGSIRPRQRLWQSPCQTCIKRPRKALRCPRQRLFGRSPGNRTAAVPVGQTPWNKRG